MISFNTWELTQRRVEDVKPKQIATFQYKGKDFKESPIEQVEVTLSENYATIDIIGKREELNKIFAEISKSLSSKGLSNPALPLGERISISEKGACSTRNKIYEVVELHFPPFAQIKNAIEDKISEFRKIRIKEIDVQLARMKIPQKESKIFQINGKEWQEMTEKHPQQEAFCYRARYGQLFIREYGTALTKKGDVTYINVKEQDVYIPEEEKVMVRKELTIKSEDNILLSTTCINTYESSLAPFVEKGLLDRKVVETFFSE